MLKQIIDIGPIPVSVSGKIKKSIDDSVTISIFDPVYFPIIDSLSNSIRCSVYTSAHNYIKTRMK